MFCSCPLAIAIPLVQTMEELVAPIAMDSHLALEGKSGKTEENAKRPAPSEAGCRIEGFVRVKKVNPISD